LFLQEQIKDIIIIIVVLPKVPFLLLLPKFSDRSSYLHTTVPLEVNRIVSYRIKGRGETGNPPGPVEPESIAHGHRDLMDALPWVRLWNCEQCCNKDADATRQLELVQRSTPGQASRRGIFVHSKAASSGVWV
jgi:hypothetical protein